LRDFAQKGQLWLCNNSRAIRVLQPTVDLLSLIHLSKLDRAVLIRVTAESYLCVT